MSTYKARLFEYEKMLPEALKRGALYWPGESIKKFGLQKANVAPLFVSDDMVDNEERFEWGEVVCLDSDGNARRVTDTDDASNFYGIVDRNASGTMGVLERQVMGMAPRLTLSVWIGGRQGVVAVPVQNITNHLTAAATKTNVAVSSTVYVRVKELGEEADAWSNDSVDYKEGAVVTHGGNTYICIDEHTSSADNDDTPGHNDAADKWSTDLPNLPIGGIETVDNDETEAWTGVTFAELATSPFQVMKYADKDTPTNVIAGIEI